MTDRRLIDAFRYSRYNEIIRLINSNVKLYDDTEIISDEHVIFFMTADLNIIKLLFAKGYPLHLRNINNQTIHTVAIKKCKIDLLRIISYVDDKIDYIMTGCNEHKNISPLHYLIIKLKEIIGNGWFAKEVKRYEMIKFLLSEGHPIDSVDNKNRTSLHYLFCKGGFIFINKHIFDLLELLLCHGANPLIRDAYGYKPSDYIPNRLIMKDMFHLLFNEEKKKTTLFDMFLSFLDDKEDDRRKRKIQRIK